MLTLEVNSMNKWMEMLMSDVQNGFYSQTTFSAWKYYSATFSFE